MSLKKKLKLRKLVKKGLNPKRKYKKKIRPTRTTWLGKKIDSEDLDGDEGWVQQDGGGDQTNQGNQGN